VPQKACNQSGPLPAHVHGWTFRNDGELLKAKDQKKGGIPEQFNTDGFARFEARGQVRQTIVASCLAA